MHKGREISPQEVNGPDREDIGNLESSDEINRGLEEVGVKVEESAKENK